MMRPAAIIFDIDDTLVNTKACHLAWQQEVLEQLGVVPADLGRARDVWRRLYHHFGHSEIRNLLTAVLWELGINGRASLVEEIAENISYRWHDWLQPCPGARDVLASTRDKEVAVAIASNGDRQLQLRKLAVTGLDEYFEDDSIIVEPPRGLDAKPGPGSILRACSALRVDPATCIYVGDRMADVVAANLAGVVSALVPAGAFEFIEPGDVALRLETPRLRLSSLGDLRPILSGQGLQAPARSYSRLAEGPRE